MPNDQTRANTLALAFSGRLTYYSHSFTMEHKLSKEMQQCPQAYLLLRQECVQVITCINLMECNITSRFYLRQHLLFPPADVLSNALS